MHTNLSDLMRLVTDLLYYELMVSVGQRHQEYTGIMTAQLSLARGPLTAPHDSSTVHITFHRKGESSQ